MTGPTDGMQVTPNEVIARVSVDIPPDTEASIYQLRQSIDTLRAGVEAVSRSTADFYEHLSTLPEIAARAGAATQSLSQTVTASRDTMARGGNVGNSAPERFMDNFSDMVAGTGRGRVSTTDQAQEYLDNLQQQDPRLFANYMSARGMPMAPQQVAQAAMAPGAEEIDVPGATPAASARASSVTTAPGSPQEIQDAQRRAAGTRGVPASQDPAQQLLNETAPGYGPGVRVPAPGQVAPDGGDGGVGIPPGAGTGMSALGGLLSKMGLGGLGGAASAVGGITTAVALAAALYKMTQMVGETVARMEKMGSVQGGGFSEGLKMEGEARALAMSPYLSLEESRDIVQTISRAGHRGKDRVVMERLMTDAQTSMNLSPGQTQAMVDVYEKAGYSWQEAAAAARSQMAAQKDLAANSEMALPEIQQTDAVIINQLTEQGVDPTIAANAAGQLGSAFSSTPGMKGILKTSFGTLNQMGLRWVLRANGITDVLSGNEARHPELLKNPAKMLWAAFRKEAMRVYQQYAREPEDTQTLRFNQRIKRYFSPEMGRDDSDKIYRQIIKDPNKDPEGLDKWGKKTDDDFGLPRISDKARDSVFGSTGENGSFNAPIMPGISVQRNEDGGMGIGGVFGDLAETIGRGVVGIFGRSADTIGKAVTDPTGSEEAAAEAGPVGPRADAGSGGIPGTGGRRRNFAPSGWNPSPGHNSYGVDPETEGRRRRVEADVRPVAYERRQGGDGLAYMRNDGTRHSAPATGMTGVLRIEGDQRLLRALGLPDSINLTQNQMRAMSGWGRDTMNNPPPGDR